ncbi:hypothetical protein C4H12_08265 [Capnocytophaga sp. oral taxon 878]|nr:hypothetical protein C4H12_08265 [Capnocytophaga sp. oral taxon 878]
MAFSSHQTITTKPLKTPPLLTLKNSHLFSFFLANISKISILTLHPPTTYLPPDNHLFLPHPFTPYLLSFTYFKRTYNEG